MIISFVSGCCLGLMIGDAIIFSMLEKYKIITSKRLTIKRLNQSCPFSGYVYLHRYLKNLY